MSWAFSCLYAVQKAGAHPIWNKRSFHLLNGIFCQNPYPVMLLMCSAYCSGVMFAVSVFIACPLWQSGHFAFVLWKPFLVDIRNSDSGAVYRQYAHITCLFVSSVTVTVGTVEGGDGLFLVLRFCLVLRCGGCIRYCCLASLAVVQVAHFDLS